MTADLTAYVPRLLLQWSDRFGDSAHQSIEGTLVFADVSGFTALSEKLHRHGGKVGAERMADIISELFADLLGLAARRGGEMLKYGGDAVLVFFEGAEHGPRAAAAALEMQRRLRSIGRVDTGAGVVRLRMSVGMHSGSFDFFVAGRRHRELVVAGPDTTTTVEMEAAADATEILLSPITAALVGERHLGAEKAGGRLLRTLPRAAGVVEAVPLPAERYDGRPFLARAVADGLLADEEPDHRVAAVAFIHVMGMDELVASGRVVEAAARLDDTLTLVEEAMEEFGVSFLATDLYHDGTKVMAAAGAPVAHADPEERMLRAARRILESSPALPVRIGVNCGHVFGAAVGPRFRRTFTTMGDVTNTAARVMAKADPGECLVLAPVLDAAGSTYEVEALEPFAAKGKTEPLVPWRVGRRIGRRTSLSDSLPLTGRVQEWGVLSQALDAFRLSGTSVAVQITGEPGMGKSRLVEELRVEGAKHHLTMVSVGCDPYGMQEPYATVRPLLTALVGGEDAAALETAVSQAAPDLRPWIPLLATALGVETTSTTEVDALDPRNRRERLHRAVSQLVQSLASSPMVFVIEDAQWADEASAALLAFLADDLGRANLLLCVSRRPDDTGLRLVEPPIDLTIGPLDDGAAKELVRRALPGGIVGAELDELTIRASGNPLFLRELALASINTLHELPSSVEGLIAARIDRLPASGRRLLRVAAVVGTTFEESLVGAADEDEDVVTAVFESLGAFIEPDPTGGDRSWRFSHQLVRDVAYEGLPYRRRRTLHGRVGLALEARAEDATEVTELLSLHFCHAGDDSRTERYSTIAGERARARYAYAQAADFFDRAAGASRERQASLLLLSGEARFDAGDARVALTTLRRAQRRLPVDSPERPRAALVAMSCMVGLGMLREADRFASRVLRGFNARGLERPEEVRIRLSQGLAALYRGQNVRAHRLGAAAADLAARRSDRAGLAHASVMMSLALPAAASERRRELALEALAIFEEIGDAHQAASTRNTLGLEAQDAGRWHEAAELFARAASDAERVGNTLNSAGQTNNLGEILLAQGQLDGALEALRTAAEIGRHRHAAWWPIAAANHACAVARSGRAEAAITELLDCLVAFEDLGWPEEICRTRLRLAEAELLAGAPGEHADRLEETHAGCESDQQRERLLGWRALARGDVDQAVALLLQAAVPRPHARATEEGVIARATLLTIRPDLIDRDDHRTEVDRLGITAVPTPRGMIGTADPLTSRS